MSEFMPEIGASSSGREAVVLNRSFPLVMLFQLATCCAGLFACIDGAVLGEILDRSSAARPSAVAAAGCVVIAGAFIGALTGLGQIRKWRGSALGVLVGSLVGMLLLCIYLAPASIGRMAAAAAAILLSTVAVRLRSA